MSWQNFADTHCGSSNLSLTDGGSFLWTHCQGSWFLAQITKTCLVGLRRGGKSVSRPRRNCYQHRNYRCRIGRGGDGVVDGPSRKCWGFICSADRLALQQLQLIAPSVRAIAPVGPMVPNPGRWSPGSSPLDARDWSLSGPILRAAPSRIFVANARRHIRKRWQTAPFQSSARLLIYAR